MRSRAFIWRWAISSIIALAVVVLAALPPFVTEPLRTGLMEAFAGLCHQMPDRSPHLDGVSLAICHRCLGIYGGVLGGVLAGPFTGRWTPPVSVGVLLVGALAVPSLDWLGHVGGLWVNTPVSRVVTGGVLGLVVGWVVVQSLIRPGTAQAEQ